LAITTTLQELRRGLSLSTGQTHQLILARIGACVVELDPGSPHGLASGVRAVFDAAEQYGGRKIIVAGHGDLPERERADAVYLLLRGDRDGWARACARHEVRHVQAVLGWAARAHGMACYPGPVDGRLGPRTLYAIARFRKHYNFEFSGFLRQHVAWGEPDWRAVYDLYDSTLCKELGLHDDELTQRRAALQFAMPPRLACGARWPARPFDSDGWRASANQRVDVLLLEDKPLAELVLDDPPGSDFYEHALAFKKEPWPHSKQPLLESFESEFALELAASFARTLTADGFAVWGSLVFGADIPRDALARLHSDLRSGSVVSAKHTLSAELDGHLAAYHAGAQRVVLNEQLVVDACGEPSLASALACVLVEEFGHHLDHLLRTQYTKLGGDAPQDEGARFACLLLCDQLAGPERFVVGTYRYQSDVRDIEADWSELKGQLAELLGPERQASDDKSLALEFSDAELDPIVATSVEATEILSIHVMVAGAETADSQALVALARQLAARLRGYGGPQVLLEGTPSVRPGPATERVILGALLRLHDALQRRLRAAPLAADGLPDLGASAWSGEPSASLWESGSPLAGTLDDVVPFGSYQDWRMRYRELAPDRAKRKRRVQMRWDRPQDGEAPSGFDPVSVAFESGVSASAHELVEDRPPDSLNDDALNAVDRSLGAVDTVFGLLELVGVEVAGSLTVALAGPVLGIATFLRGILIASEQQRRAAEGVGVVLAWFAVSAIARAPEDPPTKLTRERVDQEVDRNSAMKRMWDSQIKFSGTAPSSAQEGCNAGIERVLVPLNAALAHVDRLAREAFDRMLVQARLEQLDEDGLRERFPVEWWTLELRRRVYEGLAGQLNADASALRRRFSESSGTR
jgi:hypothetical protein